MHLPALVLVATVALVALALVALALVATLVARRRATAQPAPPEPIPAYWLRRRKSGCRVRYFLPCMVVGVTPAGSVVIERERRGRVIRETVRRRQDIFLTPA